MPTLFVKTGPHRITWKEPGDTGLVGNRGVCRYCGTKVKVRRAGRRNGNVLMWSPKGERGFTLLKPYCKSQVPAELIEPHDETNPPTQVH